MFCFYFKDVVLIVYILFQNALRAVVEKHGENVPPPINVLLQKGDEDFTIKVRDIEYVHSEMHFLSFIMTSIVKHLFDFRSRIKVVVSSGPN